jgi:hypothetical protein
MFMPPINHAIYDRKGWRCPNGYGEINAKWTPAMERDFHQWLQKNENHLPVSKATVESILSEISKKSLKSTS